MTEREALEQFLLDYETSFVYISIQDIFSAGYTAGKEQGREEGLEEAEYAYYCT